MNAVTEDIMLAIVADMAVVAPVAGKFAHVPLGQMCPAESAGTAIAFFATRIA